MKFKKHIPNIFTLGNLFCGLIALLFAFQNQLELTAFFVVLGIVLDFFDGYLARFHNVSGELGKQLDSLADVVTSGVVPGVVMYFLLIKSSFFGVSNLILWKSSTIKLLPLLGLLITLAAAYRLAKFNIDTRQSDSFIGLPTPAMSLFVVFLPVIQMNTEFKFIVDLISNNYFLIAITILLSYLMNAELPLLSLKFKNLLFKGNEFKFILVLGSIMLLVLLQFLAVPVIIIYYVILSVFYNKLYNMEK